MTNNFKRVIMLALVFLLLAVTVFFEEAGNPFFSSDVVSTLVFVVLSFAGIFLVIEILFK